MIQGMLGQNQEKKTHSPYEEEKKLTSRLAPLQIINGSSLISPIVRYL